MYVIVLTNSVLDTALPDSNGDCDSFVKGLVCLIQMISVAELCAQSDWVKDQTAVWGDLYDAVWCTPEPSAVPPETLDPVNTVEESCSVGDAAMEGEFLSCFVYSRSGPITSHLFSESMSEGTSPPDATPQKGRSVQKKPVNLSVVPVVKPQSPKVPKKYLRETRKLGSLLKSLLFIYSLIA